MKLLLNIILGTILLTSCNMKKHIYFYEEPIPMQDSNYYEKVKETYFLQPGDILYISIHSTLSETDGMFHFPGQEGLSSAGGNQNGSMYLNQSVISDEGFILIPVIGSLYVAGSTMSEIQKVIQLEARKYITDALARVKLVSYEISFMGEFINPGKITFYKDRVHILDALAEAGEISHYGDKRSVRVMRQTPTGIYTYRIDLTDKNLLTSNKFYLLPNDIVYAEPIPRKIFRLNVTDYTLVLATVTSTIAFVALMVSLNK